MERDLLNRTILTHFRVPNSPSLRQHVKRDAYIRKENCEIDLFSLTFVSPPAAVYVNMSKETYAYEKRRVKEASIRQKRREYVERDVDLSKKKNTYGKRRVKETSICTKRHEYVKSDM